MKPLPFVLFGVGMLILMTLAFFMGAQTGAGDVEDAIVALPSLDSAGCHVAYLVEHAYSQRVQNTIAVFIAFLAVKMSLAASKSDRVLPVVDDGAEEPT